MLIQSNDMLSESICCTFPNTAVWRKALNKACSCWKYLMHLEFLCPPGKARILTPITNAGTETEKICNNTTGFNIVTASNFTPEPALLHRAAYIITS